MEDKRSQHPEEEDSRLSAIRREMLDSASDSSSITGASGSGPWIPPTADELEPMLPGYEVIKMLGRGGMGAVYMGHQTSLDRPVAIKE